MHTVTIEQTPHNLFWHTESSTYLGIKRRALGINRVSANEYFQTENTFQY